MKKRRTMIVNGEQWPVMGGGGQGVKISPFPPLPKPIGIPPAPPEVLNSKAAAEKWLNAECEKVESANAAARAKWQADRIASPRNKVEVTITFPIARWHGAILLEGGYKVDMDAAEIDNLQRLHLKDGLVIKGSFKDLTSDELTRHEKILSMERPAPPSLDEIRKAVKNPSNAGRKKSNPKALDALISETRKTYRHALSTKELLSQAQAADYVLKKYCRAHRIDAPYTVDYLVKKAFKEKS